MDQELIAYLDMRFRETTQQITSLREETTQQITSLREETMQQITSLRQETTQRFEKVDERLQELKDTGRHTQVLVEDLRSRIQLVAEGVADTNQRLDAFREETREEIRAVRTRVQILEAKAARPRRSPPRPS